MLDPRHGCHAGGGLRAALHEYTEGVRPRPEEADTPADSSRTSRPRMLRSRNSRRAEHADSAPTPEHASARVEEKEPGLETTSEALHQRAGGACPAAHAHSPRQKKVSPRAHAQDRPPQITAAPPPQATAEPPAAQMAVETPAEAQGHGARTRKKNRSPRQPTSAQSASRRPHHRPETRVCPLQTGLARRVLTGRFRRGMPWPVRSGGPTKTRGGTKTSPGTIRLTCRGCGASSHVRIDRLDKQFICRRCRRESTGFRATAG